MASSEISSGLPNAVAQPSKVADCIIEVESSDEDDVVKLEKSDVKLRDTQRMTSSTNVLSDHIKEQGGSDDEIELRLGKCVKKSQVTGEDLESLIVKCSACHEQINVNDQSLVKKHPVLGVLVCKLCRKFYGNGDFSQDEEGDKYCRWCAQGGHLFGCDFCSNAFCNHCIRYNFGRGEVKRVQQSNWKCYVCNPVVLKSKVNFCDLVRDYSKGSASNFRRKSRSFKPMHLPLKDGKFDVEAIDPTKWLPECIDDAVAVASKYCDQMQVLRKLIASKGKSTKQLVRKFEHLTSELHSGAKDRISKMNEKYNLYRRYKHKLKPVSNSNNGDVVSDDNSQDSKTAIKNSIIKDTVSNDITRTRTEEWLGEQNVINNSGTVNGLQIEPCDDLNIPNKRTSSEIPNSCSGDVSGIANNPKETKDNSLDQEIVPESTVTVNRALRKLRKNSAISNSDTDSGKNRHVKKKPGPLKKQREITTSSEVLNDNVSKDTALEVVCLSSASECSDVTVKRESPEPESTKDSSVCVSNTKIEPTLKFEQSKIDPEDSVKLNETKNKSEIHNSVQKPVGLSKSSVNLTLRNDKLDAEQSVKAVKVSKVKVKVPQKQPMFSVENLDMWNKDKEKILKDPKINARTTVDICRLDMPSAKLDDCLKYYEALKEEEKIQLIEQSVDRLLADAENTVEKKKRVRVSSSDDNPKKTNKRVKKSMPKKEESLSSLSDSFTLSSDEDKPSFEKMNGLAPPPVTSDTTQKANSTINLSSELNFLSSDDSSSGRDIDDMEPKSSKSKKATKTSDDESASEHSSKKSSMSSDDDFIVNKKRNKKDEKLLKMASNLLKDDSDKNDKKKKSNDKSTKDKKKKKRKIIYSDDSESSSDSTSDSDSSSQETDSDFEKKKKKGKGKGAANKRKRVKIDDSEDSNKSSGKGSDSSPSKGRKNIRKVLSDKRLHEETREAQIAEKERVKRLQERQKLYNKITDTSKDGKQVITKKMVLEIDQDSKEEVVEIHPDIVEKLKPHQINGVKFMWESTIESLKMLETKPGSGCILAHCMGLGKTLQVIAFLYTVLTNTFTKKKLKTAMVVCPQNTVLNWASEFEMWLDDGSDPINIFEMTQNKDYYSRLECLKNWQKDGGVLIIGYEIFGRLVEGKIPKKKQDFKDKVFKCIANPGPDIVVCDEGHKLKNEKSLLSRCANKLRTNRRIVLTGTPLQNNLKEYYCMMNFVKPSLLGTFREFTNRFVNPITNGQYDNSRDHDVKLMKKRVHILHKLLEGCVQRCDYSALTEFLPPKHEFVISVKLSDIQVKLYQHYLDMKARGKISEDGTKSVDGGKLFSDYQTLKSIWSYPYALQISHEKSVRQKILKGEDIEDFLDDASISERSTSESDLECLDKDVLEAGPSKKRKRKKSDSSGDEIIKAYPRPKAGDESDSDGDNDHLLTAKQWFHEFIGPEDKYKFEYSGKMILMLEILRECESIGDKVLIFSQSLVTLDIVELLLRHINDQAITAESVVKDDVRDISSTWVPGIDYYRMDGSTHVEHRQRFISSFNSVSNTRSRVFLISTKAGSLGTNLIGANRVILLDASWNPSDDVQSIFRVYRFGQKKPVYIYRFLAQGTMEEKIYNRQVTKLSMSCRVVDEQNIDRHFNASQLAELYTFEPDTRTERPLPNLPKDRLLADLISSHKDWIIDCFEHDSLLQGVNEVELTEDERKAAWDEYENEKDGVFPNMGDEFANVGAATNTFAQPPSPDQFIQRIYKDLNTQYPNLESWRFKSLVHKNLVEKVKPYYQQILVTYLKIKTEYVSKNIPVPADLKLAVDSVQDSMLKVDAYIKQAKDSIAQYLQQQQQQQQANFRMRGVRVGPTVGGRMPFIWARVPGPQPNLRPTYFMSAPRNTVPNPGPKIVDVTQTEKDSNQDNNGTTPIVTLIDDSDSKDDKPDSATSQKHNVHIEEVE